MPSDEDDNPLTATREVSGPTDYAVAPRCGQATPLKAGVKACSVPLMRMPAGVRDNGLSIALPRVAFFNTKPGPPVETRASC